MPERRAYSDGEIASAVDLLTDPARLEEAQRLVAANAPAIQGILDRALADAEWFGNAHWAQVRAAAGLEDEQERLQAVSNLIAEETRLSMLVGVAVGYELAHVLIESTEQGD